MNIIKLKNYIKISNQNCLNQHKVRITKKVKEYSREYNIKNWHRRYYGPDSQMADYEAAFGKDY
jgi:hypothetical protein